MATIPTGYSRQMLTVRDVDYDRLRLLAFGPTATPGGSGKMRLGDALGLMFDLIEEEGLLVKLEHRCEAARESLSSQNAGAAAIAKKLNRMTPEARAQLLAQLGG